MRVLYRCMWESVLSEVFRRDFFMPKTMSNCLLSVQNIKKEYGIQMILDIKKLEIKDGMRVGLVGKNGTGKSTLLSILAGRLEPDTGSIQRNCEIAEIRQDMDTDGYADGRFISQMQIRNSSIKSGGERTRLAIAAAFSKHAPLLFADEPTSNLDVTGVNMLEKMLKGFRGAVILVSHDRKLLDEVCNEIWELSDGELRCFPGNYSDWVKQREREWNYQNFEYEQYQKEKRRLEDRVREVQQEARKAGKPPRKMSQSEYILYKGTASIQQGHIQKRAGAMISRLGHMEEKEKPKNLPHVSMKLPEQVKIKAKRAGKVEHLTVSYGEHLILDDVSLDILTGKKTFLTGRNGCGKSTLLEKLIKRGEGTFLTADVKLGYFSQGQDDLDEEKTVLENTKRNAVVPEHIVRAVLRNLYLSEEDIFKKVKVLSGGERVKTALAKILVSGCNLLVLDEPTNHMDIYTMEGLEHLLKDYDGTLLAVSHDRMFVENLADEVYELKEGKIEHL